MEMKSAQNDAKRVREETPFDAADQMPIEKKRKFGQMDNEENDIQVNDAAAVAAADDDNTEDDDSLKLDGLNNDCLRHIFEYLTLPELIDVAETSGRFVFPAAEAFSRCHSWQKFLVAATSKPMLVFESQRLQGAAMMSALNHFGARMKTISAYFNEYDMIEFGHPDPIDVVMLKQCTDSLADFQMNYCMESHFQSVIKPFTNVKKLTLDRCTLGVKFSQLSQWFPNVAVLKLLYVWLPPSIVLQATFKNLTHLSVTNHGSYDDISPQAIHQMLRLNRRLKSLQLKCNYDVEMLRTIADELRELEVLELSTPRDAFASFHTDQKFTFEMVQIFTLHAPKRKDYVMNMPFSLKNVQELRLYGFNQFHSLMVALISSGDLLNTITLLPPRWLLSTADEISPNGLARALRTRHHLSELELCSDEFRGDDLEQMIDACKQLQRLRLVSSSSGIIPIDTEGLEHDWIVCGHGTKDFPINMDDDVIKYGFEIFDRICMQRKQSE